MTDTEKLQAFVQSVYLARYNRYIDDITDTDGVEEIAKTIDWTNQFLSDFELESDWQWLRENGATLGTVTSATQTFPIPSGIRKLVVHVDRPLEISQDGTVVSQWEVVDPNHPTEVTGAYANRVTTVGDTVVFSRTLTDAELSGTVTADVINNIPVLATDDIEVLELFRPTQLLIWGVAKNATLPDIVQGGISPSFVERYAELLERTIMENEKSASADTVDKDDLSYIGGVW